MTTELQSPSGRETLRLVDVPLTDYPNILAHTAPTVAIAVPGANIGDIVLATPLGVWPAGLGMGPHIVDTDDFVETRLVNPTAGAVDAVAQTVKYTVFRPIHTGADRGSPSGRIQKITVDVTFDLAAVGGSASADQAVLVPGSLVGDTIIVTPLGVWPEGLLLGPHRCLVAGTVQVRASNVTAGALDPVSQVLRFTLIRNALHPDRQSPSGREQRRDVDVVVEVPSIATITAPDFPVLVPSSRVGDAIIVTPLGVFDDGLGMGPHRCLVAGTVQMRIGNVTVAPIDPVSQSYRFSLFRF